jgi:hypothetical protein
MTPSWSAAAGPAGVLWEGVIRRALWRIPDLPSRGVDRLSRVLRAAPRPGYAGSLHRVSGEIDPCGCRPTRSSLPFHRTPASTSPRGAFLPLPLDGSA